MESKLQELKQLVQEMFNQVEDREQIEQSAKLNQKIIEVEQEQESRQKDYQDLLHDYKEVICHTSFSSNGQVNTGSPEVKPLTFESFASEYLKNKNDNN